MKDIFEWERLLFNELPPIFLLEVVFRSTVMFLVVLGTLKLTGKRGVRQLSVFELVIIITLGSAAGDPMFYEDVGILTATVVFIVIISLYRLITWLCAKYKFISNFIEGEPVYLIEDGKFSIKNYGKESLAHDEFFTELRMRNVEHLGQVKAAIIETSGEVSVFFFIDEEVKPGLPILPHPFSKQFSKIRQSGLYACAFCGNTEEKLQDETANCKICLKNNWVKTQDNKRIA